MVYHNSPKTFLSKALFIALIFVVTLAFFPLLADPAYAASGKSAKKKTSKADVRVINLNAEISTKGLSKKEKKTRRIVRLKWKSAGSKTATRYKVYVAKGKFGKYKKVKTVTKTSAKLRLKKRSYRIKVRAYHKKKAGKASSVSVRPGKKNATVITFTQKPTVIIVGETAKIAAKANGSVDHKVKLSIRNDKILSIKKGVVTGKKAGTTTITAVAHNGLRKSISVRVIPKYPTKVSILQPSQTLVTGNKISLTAQTDEAGDTSLTWKSSNTSIATVSSDGTVTAKKKEGTATITATAKSEKGAKPAASSIEVQVIPQYPTKVTLSTTKQQTVKQGKAIQLSATASQAGDMTIKWTSSKKSVATVSSSGAVQAVGIGTTTITAKAKAASGKSAACAKVKIQVTGTLEGMVVWAEKIARDNRFGYSMGTNINSKVDRFCYFCHGSKASRDYDCASFVAAAVAHGYGGSSVMNAYCSHSGGCTTLYNTLKKAGWKDKGRLSISKLKRGDILINPSRHVEIYTGEKDKYGNVLSVAAHDDRDGKSGDSSGTEISIAPTKYFSWTNVLRLE